MSQNKTKFIFFGTPTVASETLEILKQEGFLPSLVVTSIDKPVGRKMILTPPPVKIWAEANNIPVLQSEKIDNKFFDEIIKTETDLYLVVAFGKILPEKLINYPKFGTINIHYSLLPKYRGASPVESALLAGDNKTGVSIQKMVFKLDSGPIIAKQVLAIDINDNKESLRKKLVKIGGQLFLDILLDYMDNKIELQNQDESDATYCHKIKKEDGEISLNGNYLENYNKYRAFYGWPGIFFFKEINGKKTRFKITKARLENNKFIIEKVIPEGKKEIDYK